MSSQSQQKGEKLTGWQWHGRAGQGHEPCFLIHNKKAKNSRTGNGTATQVRDVSHEFPITTKAKNSPTGNGTAVRDMSHEFPITIKRRKNSLSRNGTATQVRDMSHELPITQERNRNLTSVVWENEYINWYCLL